MSATSEPSFLPEDLDQALLVGRVWRKSDRYEGPCVVAVRGGYGPFQSDEGLVRDAGEIADYLVRSELVDPARLGLMETG